MVMKSNFLTLQTVAASCCRALSHWRDHFLTGISTMNKCFSSCRCFKTWHADHDLTLKRWIGSMLTSCIDSPDLASPGKMDADDRELPPLRTIESRRGAISGGQISFRLDTPLWATSLHEACGVVAESSGVRSPREPLCQTQS
jgi:hypothetical protein